MDLLAAVEQCQYHRWTALYRHNRFRSHSLPLPPDFDLYMSSDSIEIPSLSSDSPLLRSASLLDLMRNIQEIIEEIGPVVPKLNWSTPVDAVWMHDLRCEKAEDVLILLKSSDQVMQDLETFRLLKQRFQESELILTLVKYHALRDGMQFRCFILETRLIAISQRDGSHMYPFLVEMKERIGSVLAEFYESQVKEVFPLRSCR